MARSTLRLWRDHSLTIILALVWLGFLGASGAAYLIFGSGWLVDVLIDHSGSACGSFMLLVFGRLLWLRERGRADKRHHEEPDV